MLNFHILNNNTLIVYIKFELIKLSFNKFTSFNLYILNFNTINVTQLYLYIFFLNSRFLGVSFNFRHLT